MSSKSIAQFAAHRLTSTGVTVQDASELRRRASLKLKQAMKLIEEARALEAQASAIGAK